MCVFDVGVVKLDVNADVNVVRGRERVYICGVGLVGILFYSLILFCFH